MDYYTKLFLINVIAILFTMKMDRVVFNDALEKLPVVGVIMGLWAAMSLLSIPAWIVYMIVNL